jgi:outer membrane immunogenic protein
MIRRVLLSAVCTVALLPAAFAADIYTPPPAPYAAVVLPTWSGFYIGINGGYGGNSSLGFTENVFYPNLPVGVASPYSFLAGNTTIAGGFGGGQLGYNWQFGSFVAGFEADIQGSDIQGSGSATIFNPTLAATTPPAGFPGFCGVGNAGVMGSLTGVCAGKNDLQVDYFGTVRGRLGWVWGGTLIYGTGGFAYGSVKSSFAYSDNNYNTVTSPCTAAAPCFTQHGVTSNTSTSTGWVAGAGVEYKISSSWSLKGEYQFIDLGSISSGSAPIFAGTGTHIATPCPTGSGCLNLRGSNSEVSFNTVRVGLNYHFFAAEPVPLK